MDKGTQIGIIMLIISLVVIGAGYYYMTKNIPKK
jgi:uncharacterized protein YpmB